MPELTDSPDLKWSRSNGELTGDVTGSTGGGDGGTSLTTGNLLATVGVEVHLVYRSERNRWELPDGTAPDLTGRKCSLIWEGTKAQIPAQGTGDTQVRIGDTVLERDTSL